MLTIYYASYVSGQLIISKVYLGKNAKALDEKM